MNKIVKEIILLFIVVVFANMVVEFGEEEKSYLTNPVKFFGVALGVSIIGGFINHWVKSKQNTPK